MEINTCSDLQAQYRTQIVLGNAGEVIWLSVPALCTSLPKYCPMLFQWRSQTSYFQVLFSPFCSYFSWQEKQQEPPKISCLLKDWELQYLSTLLAEDDQEFAAKCHILWKLLSSLKQCSKGGFAELPAKCWHVLGSTGGLPLTNRQQAGEGLGGRRVDVLSWALQAQGLIKPWGLASSWHLEGPVSITCSREPWKIPLPSPRFLSSSTLEIHMVPSVCNMLKQISKTHLYGTDLLPLALSTDIAETPVSQMSSSTWNMWVGGRRAATNSYARLSVLHHHQSSATPDPLEMLPSHLSIAVTSDGRVS